MPRPVHIREDDEPVMRERCLRFLERLEVKFRAEFQTGNHYWETVADLSDLTTEALARIAAGEVRRFWGRRRRDRESQAFYRARREAA